MAEGPTEKRSRSALWRLGFIFFFLSAGIGAAGFMYYQQERKSIRKAQSNNLAAIADLKVRQISDWRHERQADAELIYNNQPLCHSIRQFLQSPGNEALASEILGWMGALRKNFDYHDAFLLDPEGNIRLALTDGPKAVDDAAKALIPQAVKNDRVVLSDLHRSPNIGFVHMDMLVPCVIQDSGEVKTVGLVFLRIDPERFLYPLIQSWPVPSTTGESLLVKQEKGSVVYLNDLRHIKNSALALRFPITKKYLPAARVVLGEEGTSEGVDYRGVPVLAAMRHIPNSPWHIVAKMDLQEVDSPLQRQIYLVAALIVAMLAAAAVSVALFWRRHTEHFYRHHHETELDYQALTRRYTYLSQFASDAILLLDRESNVLDANERAASLYGYTRDELIHLRLGNLEPSLTVMGLGQQMRQADEREQGFTHETLHRQRAGTRFPVEVSLYCIDVEGTRLYQAIIRDISERKRAEDALRESKEMFATVFRETPAVVSIVSMKSGSYIDVNRAFEEITGFTREQAVGKSPVGLGILTNDHTLRHVIRTARERQSVSDVEIVFRDKTGHPLLGLLSATQIHVGGETCLLVVVTDITERKRSEEATRASEYRFRSVVMQAPVGIFEIDNEGKYTFVNQHWTRITGFSAEEALGHSIGSFLHPEDRERVIDEWTQTRNDGQQFVVRGRLQTSGGNIKKFITSILAMTNDRDEMIGFVGTLSEIN